MHRFFYVIYFKIAFVTNKKQYPQTFKNHNPLFTFYNLQLNVALCPV